MDFENHQIINGRYKITEKIAQGQAIIYKAKDMDQKRTVIIKQYKTEHLYKEDLRQVETEAVIAKQIQHPLIAECYEFFRAGNDFILVIEFVPGLTLRKVCELQFGESPYENADIKQLLADIPWQDSNVVFKFQRMIEKRYPATFQSVHKFQPQLKLALQKALGADTPDMELDYETLCLALIKQVAAAISELHKLNVIHRDVSLNNVILTSSNNSFEAKLIDFGASNSTKESNEVIGTPGFTAPEIVLIDRKEDAAIYGQEVDCWGIGACLYGMLHGYPPVIVSRRNIEFLKNQARVGLLLPMNPALSDVTRMLIEQLLRREPANRITSKQVMRVVDTQILLQKKLVLEQGPQEATQYYRIKTLLLGERHVGKTALIRQLTGQVEVGHVTQKVVPFERFVAVFDFYDTLGMEDNQQSMQPAFLRNVNLCLLVYNDEKSFEALDYWRRSAEANSSKCLFVTAKNCQDDQIAKEKELFLHREMEDFYIVSVLIGLANLCVQEGYYQSQKDQQVLDVVNVQPISNRKHGCC